MAFQLDSSLNITTLTTALVSIGLASLVWWRRLRRLSGLRQRVARIHDISEEILGTSNTAQIVELLDRRLTEILGHCRAAIYLLDSTGSGLEPAEGAKAVPAAAAACQDVGRPGIHGESLLLPMFAQGSQTGVLELRSVADWRLQDDERGALKHMANQIAIAIRLMDQRRLREQLLRSEQLGAAGVLVSNVASELRPPLSRIIAAAAQQGLAGVSAEAGAALETLDRIISIGRPEQARIQPFDLNQTISQLAEFRSRTWRLRALTATTNLSTDDLTVLGARGQIEQAVLGLLVAAEQNQEESAVKSILIETCRREGHAVLTIRFPAPLPLDRDSASGLAAARSMIENYGGTFLQQSRAHETSFEIALPLTAGAAAPPFVEKDSALARSLTILLAHPDATVLRQLISALGDRGHRAVASDTAGHALDLAARIRFDALFASRSLKDLDWPRLAAGAQQQVATVGLLCGASELAPPGIVTLHLPLEEPELDQILTELCETA